MVGAGLRGSINMLGRCSIVNHHGNVVYDTFVAPNAEVTDYRTPISGIRRADLVGGMCVCMCICGCVGGCDWQFKLSHSFLAPNFATVQSEVKNFLLRRILVGHDLRHDFSVSHDT